MKGRVQRQERSDEVLQFRLIWGAPTGQSAAYYHDEKGSVPFLTKMKGVGKIRKEGNRPLHLLEEFLD